MRENFTSFEQEIMRELSLAANKRIMPYDFIAKHMKAIAIELLKDDRFAIVTSKPLPKDFLEYSLAEKSILDLMYILSYLEEEKLIVPQHCTRQELKVGDKAIRIFDKDEYKYNEEAVKKRNDILTEEELIEALRNGRYSHPTTINNQYAENFYLESKLEASVYIYDFIKKHYGCFLYVSPALVELVNDDFKTHDQIRFEKQLKDSQQKHEESMLEAKKQTNYAQWAFYAAMGALIVSLSSTIITQCSNDNELIRNEIRSTKTETPKLINQQIKNDTLKVNMIKK